VTLQASYRLEFWAHTLIQDTASSYSRQKHSTLDMVRLDHVALKASFRLKVQAWFCPQVRVNEPPGVKNALLNVLLRNVLLNDLFSWVWGCCVMHQSVSSVFKSVACLQGHMVRPESSLSWNFDSLLWGYSVLHQSMSSIFESEAWLQGLMVRHEQSLCWNVFEWRAENSIFAPKDPHYWGGGSLTLTWGLTNPVALQPSFRLKVQVS
jgi:hypothetical protein